MQKIYDEFLFFHDTFIIKDLSLLEDLFKSKGGLLQRRQMYIGYYDSNILKSMNIIEPKTKKEAIESEFIFGEEYMKLTNRNILYPDLYNTTYISSIKKYGRIHRIYENSKFIKYQATWDLSMVK